MQSYVLVLIAPPASGKSLAAVAGCCREERAGIQWSLPVTLSDGEAIEIPFDAESATQAAAARAAVAAEHAGKAVDICVVPAANRRKRLLIADMDSTIIGQECIDEMADVLGLKPEIAAITERAMRGELPFEAALTERLGLLAGITEAALDRVWRERVRLNPGARTLIATMRKHGAYTALVSGGFTYFTNRVAAVAGFDMDRANTLEIVDGKLTGQVVGPILGREAKLASLKLLRTELLLKHYETLAVGDGANDLAMIEDAGLGVAYKAKPVVAAEAQAAIDHGDLTALLYLQGYRKAEFVVPA